MGLRTPQDRQTDAAPLAEHTDSTPAEEQPPARGSSWALWGSLLACWVCLGYLIALYAFDFRLTLTPQFTTSVPDLAPFFGTPKAVPAKPRPTPPPPAPKPAKPLVLRGDSLYPALTTDRQVDTSRQRILLMGDSMAEALYFPFINICKWSNFYFKVCAVKGTTSLYWAEKDTLVQAIERFRPTLILFTCGANEITIPRLRVRKRMYERVLARFDTLPYIWVGTPVWTGDTVYGNMMRELVPQDQLFISQGITMSLQRDGAHPDMAGARVWADSLARWMVYHSRYPVYWQIRRPAHFVSKIKNGSPLFAAEAKAQPRKAPADTDRPSSAAPQALKPADTLGR